MDCLSPPMEEAPPGDWFCPLCPTPDDPISADLSEPEMLASCPSRVPVREASVASSSRTGPRLNGSKKGKERAMVTDESEVETDALVSPRQSSRRKTRHRGKSPAETEQEVEEVVQTETPRPPKRPRLRLASPVPPPPPPLKPPTIRLRLPPRGKGKEREQEVEEVQKGMFDDFLPPQDRDVVQTTITEGDKQRMERSRIVTEVRLPAVTHVHSLTIYDDHV